MSVLHNSKSSFPADREPTLNWLSAELVRAQRERVPKVPGLYAIKRVKRIFGLPLPDSIIYVGRTNNLRRRFLEHINPVTEHNQKLLEMSWQDKLEFWFAEAPIDKLSKLERALIKRLEPMTNIVGNLEKNHDN